VRRSRAARRSGDVTRQGRGLVEKIKKNLGQRPVVDVEAAA